MFFIVAPITIITREGKSWQQPGLEIQFLPNIPPPTTGCADPCGDLDGVLELTLVCRVHILEPYIHTYENMT